MTDIPPPPEDDGMSAFERDLTALLSKHSKEGVSGTPDFILARYLWECLAAFSRAVRWRRRWWGPKIEMTDHREIR